MNLESSTGAPQILSLDSLHSFPQTAPSYPIPTGLAIFPPHARVFTDSLCHNFLISRAAPLLFLLGSLTARAELIQRAKHFPRIYHTYTLQNSRKTLRDYEVEK